MRKLLCVFFILVSSHTYSQVSQTDSLKNLLKTAKHDTVRCYILNTLVEYEYDEKIWPIYNEQLAELAQKNATTTTSKYLKTFYLKCYANSLNNKGFLEQEHGDIAKALEYYSKALKTQEQIDDKKGMATTINNIAYIYMHQGDMDKALESVKKAMQLQIDVGDSAGVALSLNNLGNIYKNKNDIPKALDYFNKSLELQKRSNNEYGVSICLSNIGDIYIGQGDRSKGVEYILQSLKIREEMKELDGIAYNLDRLANAMLDLGRLNEALEYGVRSLKVAKELNFIENIRNASKTLYKIYKKQNNANAALQMYELYFQLHDSISNETTRKSSIKNQFQYEYEKKAFADSVRVHEEKKVINAQLKQEKTQRFALYGGIFLVGLFGIFMFNRFKVTKKQNDVIQLQKTELQQQKELVEEHQKETLDSIHYAKRIQTALIANSDFITQHISNNFIYFNPKDIVSGDFYWATKHNDKFYLAVCDSTGHGVPGAFMSLLNMGFLSEAIKEKNIEMPNEIFNYVRERLITTISDGGQKDGMDGILICIDKNSNTIEYAAANNEPILIRNNEVIELPKDKMPVGKGEKTEKFVLHSIELKSGDALYLYTDGFADQFGGPKGKKFKYRQLNDLLLTIKDAPLSTQKDKLESAFENWRGEQEQVDDVLIIGIKV